MKKRISDHQHNIILIIGVVLFTIGLLLLDFTKDSINLYSTDNFSLLAVQAIFITPLIEEIVFRGSLLSKSKLYILSLAATFAYFVYQLFSLKLFTVLLCAIFIISMLLHRRNSSKHNTLILMIINSVCFGLLHFNSELTQASLLNLPYTQFGLGLILSWIMINYTLKASIIGHSIFNSILILILFISLQFPSSKVMYIKTENYMLTIVPVPYYSEGNYTYTFEDGTHSYKNTSIKKLITFPPIRNIKVLKDITSNDLFGRYNVTIVMKEGESLEPVDILNDLKSLELIIDLKSQE